MPDIQVINHNPFALKGRFAGVDYWFPPNKPVSLPEKAAEHIFALDQDKEHKTGALNRLGLLKPNDPNATLEKAYQYLDKVTFAQGHTVFEEHQPLPPPSAEQPIGDNPGAPRNPGGESGAEADVAPASSPDALAREVLARRKRPGAPSGG